METTVISPRNLVVLSGLMLGLAGCNTTTDTAKQTPAAAPGWTSPAQDKVDQFLVHRHVATLYVEYCGKSDGLSLAQSGKAATEQFKAQLVKQGYDEAHVDFALLNGITSKGQDRVGQGVADHINAIDYDRLSGTGAPICKGARDEIARKTPVGKMLRKTR